MDVYIVDTVAFLAYLANTLPPKADSKFKDAEMKKIKLLLPTIALGETLYTIYKGKEIFGKAVPLEKVEFIFNVLEVEETIQLVDMNIDAWRIFHGLFISELHDRMIVATFKYYKATGIITDDPEISKYIPNVW